MVRPIYESLGDVQNETAVKDQLEKIWNVELHKLPESYQLDYLATRGEEGKMWVEIKCRKIDSGKFPSIILSMHKYIKGIDLAKTSGLPFIFVVQTNDKLMWYEFDIEHNYGVRLGGRTVKRRDYEDVEPIIDIPMDWFRELNVVGG